MKTFLLLFISILLFFGVAIPAYGDIFTTAAGVSFTRFEIEGTTAPFNYLVSGNVVSFSFDGEVDLGVRPGIGISYGNIYGDNFTTIYPRIDWGFQILDYTFRISEGYLVHVFKVNSAVPVSYSYAGLTLGVNGQWKLSEMLTFFGTVQIPQTGYFYRDTQVISAENSLVHSFNYGLKITVLPLISFTLNSCYTEIGNDSSPFRLKNEGLCFGAFLRW